jgi:hypothetical protein
MTHAGVVYLGLAAYTTRGRNPNVPYRFDGGRSVSLRRREWDKILVGANQVRNGQPAAVTPPLPPRLAIHQPLQRREVASREPANRRRAAPQNFCKNEFLCLKPIERLPSSFALALGNVAHPNTRPTLLVGRNENNAGLF